MRIPHDPYADLAQAITTAAISLEQLSTAHSLRIAGERLLSLARETIEQLPTTLLPALTSTERKEMSTQAKQISEYIKTFGDIYHSHTKSVAAYTKRSRDISDAAFFEEFFKAFAAADYATKHIFHDCIPADALPTAYKKWHALHDRQEERKKHLPAIEQAMLLRHALENVSKLAHTIELKE